MKIIIGILVQSALLQRQVGGKSFAATSSRRPRVTMEPGKARSLLQKDRGIICEMLSSFIKSKGKLLE